MTIASFLPSAPLRILHLEDNQADCDLVQESLRLAGLETEFTTVGTRDAFVGALMRARFDLILADYSLPGYDGLSALEQARELQPAVPFLFFTGTIGEERAVELVKDGAADCVLKARLERLAPAVRRALQDARERGGRHAAEAALRESEARFREMAANIREVFWIASADGQVIQYISPAYERIWGRPVTALMSRPESWEESVWTEDLPRVKLARQRLTQGTPCDHEYRILQPDGSCRWIEERIDPVRGPDGGVERMVGVARDITGARLLQEQLHQAQKIESIGQLAGGIAHDFSNLLTVINGYSNLLLDNPALPPALAESLRQIYVAGGRAAALTRQLLIFSRKSQAHSHPVELNEIVTDLSAMLRRMIGENINLELDLAHPLPRVLADPSMLEQVLMNLVVNARDAMPKGGSLVVGTGSCETNAEDCSRNPEARPGPHVWLSVRDTGCGIAPELLTRIFEPFFTTKAEGKGTGLGLATVFGIAKQHHGWIEVESDVGLGTLFRVFLPVASVPEPARARVHAESPHIEGGAETILLVEDEETVRAFARTVLQMNGYKVLEAASGTEARETWKWHGARVSLLLTDLVLPDEITGLELAEKFQAERPALRVLFSSGYNPETAREVLQSRANISFLQKPYPPKTLARMVREVLDHGVSAPESASRSPFS